jgi:hypothetical protein|tara:strand:+ start:492 stop:644 length:153 start_codon:yes stop_codon:yes gene_type:complete
MYNLILKSESREVIDRISADSLQEATAFFIGRKQMDEETFNKLYEVKQDD